MKRKFLEWSNNTIIKNNPNIDSVKLEEIMYGLEGVYLTITKMIIISLISALLGIIKEVILLLIIYNVIRANAYGLHASKSIYCLITSILLFVGGVYICKYLHISIIIKCIISILCIVCLIKYAPADTEKRPLINSERRKRHKIYSVITGIVYFIFIIYFSNNIISNYFLIGLIESILMIHPIMYKIFNMSYNNYLSYDCNS